MSFKIALLALAAQGSLAEIVAYWGNGGETPADGNLADWCADNEHIDILNLAFITNFGHNHSPNGDLGYCHINEDGSSNNCEQLEQDIGTCQSMGKKVFLSLPGSYGDFGLNSNQDAEGVAYSLWNQYGAPNAVQDLSKRPLGNVRIDGWDIDIESNPYNEDGNGYLGHMLNTLRKSFEADTANKYYIGGAPQCYLNQERNMDINMGNSINQAQYDYLWIQFYNNDCAAAYANDGSDRFNLDKWPGVIANGASKNAKLLVGIPGNQQEAPEFIPVDSLPNVYEASKGVQNFDGFMVYEVGDTKSVDSVNGCDYFAQLYSVYTTGHTC
ncbi:related to class III chitinase ChiA2 [Ramularia collo-cygni]|uniref:Related to class III chitinase ChiA2 n=1 Tax=Ramularia collo-cygni TaxID=112498 RepID=A0A2D3UTF7_9PEZI|nr:related to class III chitinase ChiA2 [Ramularia collo-cygni]CZT19701.1 related to class III chitinase ChiA2 [Ramularia collo-cygni]